MIIGTNGLTGMDSCTPRRPEPQPHWSTATITP